VLSHGVRLKNILSGKLSKDCHVALDRGDPTKKAVHTKKLNAFGAAARSSLCKHFDHWIKAPLLPASLTAVAPVANVIAAAMRNEDPAHGMPEDQMTVEMPFVSNVHKRIVDLKAFRKFLNGQLETIQDDNDHTAESIS